MSQFKMYSWPNYELKTINILCLNLFAKTYIGVENIFYTC
jgi:hypothetical protein